MKELIFIVEELPEGGYTARAIGESIYTEADDLNDSDNQVRDAVHCHFEKSRRPGAIRLHFAREEVIAAWNFLSIYQACSNAQSDKPGRTD